MSTITIKKSYNGAPTKKVEISDLLGAFVQAQREIDPKKGRNFSNQLKGTGHDHCRAFISKYIFKALTPALSELNHEEFVSLSHRYGYTKGYPVLDYRVVIRAIELLQLDRTQVIESADTEGVEALNQCAAV